MRTQRLGVLQEKAKEEIRQALPRWISMILMIWIVDGNTQPKKINPAATIDDGAGSRNPRIQRRPVNTPVMKSGRRNRGVNTQNAAASLACEALNKSLKFTQRMISAIRQKAKFWRV